MGGEGAEQAHFERVNPELGGGERSKARVRKAVKMGSGDASDAMDAEQGAPRAHVARGIPPFELRRYFPVANADVAFQLP